MKAAFNEREHDLPKATFRPVKKTSVKPFVITERLKGGCRGPMLMPPSSFILPARSSSRETSRKSSLPDEAVVRASNSSHPASTPHISPDSQNQMEFSPSSEASLSSRGLEEDEDREDNSSVECWKEEKEEKENGEMVDMEDGKMEEELDKEGEEENSEDEGEERDEDTSDGEEVGEGRKPKKVREKTVGNQLFDQQRDQGNLQERIAAMKNTLHEFQELKTAYR